MNSRLASPFWWISASGVVLFFLCGLFAFVAPENFKNDEQRRHLVLFMAIGFNLFTAGLVLTSIFPIKQKKATYGSNFYISSGFFLFCLSLTASMLFNGFYFMTWIIRKIGIGLFIFGMYRIFRERQ